MKETIKPMLHLKPPTSPEELKPFFEGMEYISKFRPRLLAQADRITQILDKKTEWK